MNLLNEVREFTKWRYYHGDRAPLPDDFVDSFEGATNRKPSKRMMTDRQDIISWLTKENFVRWNRLNRDFKWLRKKMQKAGLNPDDAAFLLLTDSCKPSTRRGKGTRGNRW